MGENQRIHYNREYERCMTEERECKRKKNDAGTRGDKTGIEWKERKEGAECAMRRERQLRTCGKDAAKWERGKERNGAKYWVKTEGR
jgi:hypothetical protein